MWFAKDCLCCIWGNTASSESASALAVLVWSGVPSGSPYHGTSLAVVTSQPAPHALALTDDGDLSPAKLVEAGLRDIILARLSPQRQRPHHIAAASTA